MANSYKPDQEVEKLQKLRRRIQHVREQLRDLKRNFSFQVLEPAPNQVTPPDRKPKDS